MRTAEIPLLLADSTQHTALVYAAATSGALRATLRSLGLRPFAITPEMDAAALCDLLEPAIVLSEGPATDAVKHRGMFADRGLPFLWLGAAPSEGLAQERSSVIAWPASDLQVRHAVMALLRPPGAARIVVVDVDDDLALIFGHMFEREGWTTTHVRVASELAGTVGRLPPDLLIINPAMVGLFEAIVALRSSKARSLPLLVYSSREYDDEERSRWQLGPTRHLTKPREMDDLLNTVGDLLYANGLRNRST